MSTAVPPSSTAQPEAPGDAPFNKSGEASTKATHAYARFIPREELAEFAAWTPDAFELPPDQVQQPGVRAAAPKPPPPPPPPEEDWPAKVQAARQAGYRDGTRDGMQSLEAAKRQIAQQVSGLITQLQPELEALHAQMAQAVIDVALQLAAQVVRSELTQNPQLIERVAGDAVQALVDSASSIQLRLHPDDAALLHAAEPEWLAARPLVVVADAQISRGGCLLTSGIGQVDARIESRWAQAAATLGRDLPYPTAAAEGTVMAPAHPPSDAPAAHVPAVPAPHSAAPTSEGDDA